MLEFERVEFPPELGLIIACARWPIAALDKADIRRRLAEPIDWGLFLDWVGRNRVTPLVYNNLRHVATIAVPETVGNELRAQAAHNVRRVLMQIREAARITRLLNEAGIRTMMIKGPALAMLAFDDPTLRESQDVDLLIDPARLYEADRLIRQAGYQRTIPKSELTECQFATYQRLQCQFVYDSLKLGVTQELHWRLTSNPHLLHLEEAAMWSRSEPIVVAGAQFATLPDEELFLYLCVHGSGHMWFRLKWIVDIAALIQKFRPETLDRISGRARDLGALRSFHSALLLANRVLAAPVSAEILESARQDKVARQLTNAACKALTWGGSPADPVETPWFSTWLNWQAFKLRPGFRYRLNELRIRMLSVEDWTSLPLPDWLFPLYIPLRPIAWVMRKARQLTSAARGRSR